MYLKKEGGELDSYFTSTSALLQCTSGDGQVRIFHGCKQTVKLVKFVRFVQNSMKAVVCRFVLFVGSHFFDVAKTFSS